jgi:peptide/nickel transport system permease protein
MVNGNNTSALPADAPQPQPVPKPRARPNNRLRLLRRFLRHPLAVGGAVFLLIVLFCAVFAPFIAPQNPYDLEGLSLSNSLLPPIWKAGGSWTFPLGTDQQGRDILSTIMYGSRTSLIVGFAAVVLASLIGGFIGLLAGYFENWFDTASMRLADSLLAFSTTLIALLLLGVFQHGSLLLVVVAIVIGDWVQFARTMRGSVLAIKEEDYVLAARATGAGHLRIIIKHIMPNAVSPLLVIAAVNFGVAVMLEATLSFLGVGLPVTEPSLGTMISEGMNFIYAGMWWLIVFPALILMGMVFSLNLIADWLRDEINPRLKKV